MTSDFPPPLLLETRATISGRFKNFDIIKRFDSEGGSTPQYTPTTLSLRLSKTRPQVFEAVESPSKKKVAIKAVYHTERKLLENEWYALQKLNALKFWFPWLPKIAPSLKQDLRFFQQNHNSEGIWFIAYEWLDKENNWEQLSTIIKKQPLFELPDAALHMQNLQNTLLLYTHIMHLLGISHGDNKDEHIFIYKKDEKYFFNKILLIDFGTSYLTSGEDWKGGSLGFSRPRFWREMYQKRLSISEIRDLDWYGVYTTLYYAYTGECFPASAPSFGKLSNEQEIVFLSELKNRLDTKWRGRLNQQASETISKTIEKLCSPYGLSEDNTMKFITTPLVNIFKLNYQFLLTYITLTLGTVVTQIKSPANYLIMPLAVLTSIFFLVDKFDKNYKRNFLGLFLTSILLGVMVVWSNLELLSLLFPYVILSLFIVFFLYVLKKKEYIYLVLLSLLGPLILNNPLLYAILAVGQAIVLPFKKKTQHFLLLGSNVVSVFLLWIWLLLRGTNFNVSTILLFTTLWVIVAQVVYALRQQGSRN